MCFTVNVNLVKEELESRFGTTLIDRDKYRPSYYYHAFSLPQLPVFCSGPEKQLRLLTWGLIPSWAKSRKDADEIRFKTFNARSESAAQKPSYANSMKSFRCLIPVSGFYEWQHVEKEKIPWFIKLRDDKIMIMAGLYNDWTDTNTGELCGTFSVVTTAANDLMAEIHNSGRRMPLILGSGNEDAWLDTGKNPSDLDALMKPFPQELLTAYTISPLISSRTADKNREDLIKPYTYYKDNLLF